jgi:cell division protein FtsL
MIKLLHVLAIGTLISSALYAYTIKYDTTVQNEQLQKVRNQTQKEREAIAVLKAEWQYLNRPDRLQALANQHLELVPLSITQIARVSDVPMRAPKVDSIGQKLEAMGLFDPVATSSTPRATTPRVTTPATPVQRPLASNGPKSKNIKPASSKLAAGAITPRPLAKPEANKPMSINSLLAGSSQPRAQAPRP